MTDPRAFIAANLPVRLVPDLPGIRLHMAVPQSGVWRLACRGEPPYWAWCWPGGLALARHLARRPELVAGRRVFDLGTGSGLVAIAAALAGAARVTACDTDPNALAALSLNAALNGVAIRGWLGDGLAGPVPDCDVVLVGDLFYAADLAARTLSFLERCHAGGLAVYVGDIGRDHLPRARLAPIAAYKVRDFGQSPATPAHRARVYCLGTMK